MQSSAWKYPNERHITSTIVIFKIALDSFELQKGRQIPRQPRAKEFVVFVPNQTINIGVSRYCIEEADKMAMGGYIELILDNAPISRTHCRCVRLEIQFVPADPSDKEDAC